MKTRLLALVLCAPLFAVAEEANSDAARAATLKHLGGAIKGYQIIHDTKPPMKLSDLYRDGLADSFGDFVRPGSGTTITMETEIDAKSDYTLEPLPDVKNMLVREKTPVNNNVLVLLADGSIKSVPTSQSAETTATAMTSPTATVAATASAAIQSPTAAAAVSATPAATAVASPATPPMTTLRTRQILAFDKLQPGALSADAFADNGVRVIRQQGEPAVHKSALKMVLPPGRSQVLLVSGDRVTSLSFTFSAPIRRFTIMRIGTAAGASVPTWTMQAFNQKGKVLDSIGETHGLPTTPQEFSVKGTDIVTVQLSTDNRFGDGTWATWNCLPLVHFMVER
jgi:hypothetical protein